MTCATWPGAWSDVGTSYMAWWKFGSNFSPCGANFLTPFLSRIFMSSRSVSSTPSISALTFGSAPSRKSGPIASSARCMLSATARTSRAKPAMPYARASRTSRSVRLRRFSISARVRSSLSLYWAASRVASATGSAVSEAAVSTVSSAMVSPWRAVGSVIVLNPPSAYPDAPDIRALSAKIKRSGGQQAAYDARRIVDHGNNASIVKPCGSNHPDYADNAAFAVAIGRNDGRGAGKRKQIVLGTDEDAHSLSSLSPAEQIYDSSLGFQRIKQRPHALKVLNGTQVLQQIGVTAHDELTLLVLATRPAGKA